MVKILVLVLILNTIFNKQKKYKDFSNFGERGRTLTEHILSSERDTNKR